MKKNGLMKVSLAALAFCVSTQVFAEGTTQKATLAGDYTVQYNLKPVQVDNFTDMFNKGELFGRLRSNTFLFNYSKTTASDTLASGLGGSLIYQSGIFDNFDVRLGLYYTHGFVNDASTATINNLKGGADVLNRPAYRSTGTQDLGVLGQSYIRYTGIPKSEVKVGRQLVETFFTASNDTKMIPETFDGVVFNTNVLPNTKATVAYLADEKMRGHADTNSPLVYSSSTTSDSINDDTVMAKGLTYANLMKTGKSTAEPLVIAEVHNSSITNLKLDAAGYIVPELVSQAMVEGNYKFALSKDFSITPGVRYLHQFDEGAGVVGGASLSGKAATTANGGLTAGRAAYTDPSSMNSDMIAARIVAKYQNYSVNLAYSKVYDKADLVDPWRAFPTAGYTRSMARYNWYADSRSTRLQFTAKTNFTPALKDLNIELSALHTDNDIAKGLSSENYYYLGFMQNLPKMPQFQWRFRIGYDDILNGTSNAAANDNLDTRLEFNYLF